MSCAKSEPDRNCVTRSVDAPSAANGLPCKLGLIWKIRNPRPNGANNMSLDLSAPTRSLALAVPRFSTSAASTRLSPRNRKQATAGPAPRATRRTRKKSKSLPNRASGRDRRRGNLPPWGTRRLLLLREEEEEEVVRCCMRARRGKRGRSDRA